MRRLRGTPSQGPNVFPGAGATAEYNTVDAALWYIEAWRAYVEASGDLAALEEVFSVLAAIIEAHVTGTRFGIGVAADGLLRAGEPGVQLTWMDAKVGDWVVTPRMGKPVEINALWYNALCGMAAFADHLKVTRHQLDSLRRLGIPETPAHDQEAAMVAAPELILDGLLGYSLKGAPRNGVAALIRLALRQGAPIVSLDLPSGIDATTGEVHEPAISAAATLTLALPKTGLYAAAARAHIGELYLADIGVPPQLYAGPDKGPAKSATCLTSTA